MSGNGLLARLFGGGRVKRTANWPLAEGVITLYNLSGDDSELAYSYNVKGRNYYGHTINFLIRPEHIQSNLDIEDQGIQIRVRFNPERPSNCSIAGKDNPHLHFRINPAAQKALQRASTIGQRIPQGQH
ncbi:MAG TPA: hypothetical protein VG844_11045 [Terracidiphilus sp.]|jgi:hypothetical protein|nr:hypothetical protein [Terracidiphilus sp.]